jgi:hypothetical protein
MRSFYTTFRARINKIRVPGMETGPGFNAGTAVNIDYWNAIPDRPLATREEMIMVNQEEPRPF